MTDHTTDSTKENPMSDNTQELREKIRHYLISTQQDGAGIATGRRSTDGSLYKSRIDEFTEMIMSDIKSQTNQAVLEALDLYEKDMQGYNFTPEDYEGGEDTNALVADALKNSKEYVRKELSGKEPTHE